jgi:hypothetical protein
MTDSMSGNSQQVSSGNCPICREWRIYVHDERMHSFGSSSSLDEQTAGQHPEICNDGLKIDEERITDNMNVIEDRHEHIS